MSYALALAGLKERIQTVAGLQDVLDYEPSSIQRLPMVYLLLTGFRRTREGGITVMRYRVTVRLLIRYQDNEKAEWELIPFVNSLAAAIDADPQFAGRIDRGYAEVSQEVDARAWFPRAADTKYRGLDVPVDIIDKAAYQSGI